MIARFSFPTRIIFGSDAIYELPKEVASFKAKRVLIVADLGVIGAGIVAPIRQLLTDKGISTAIFDGVHPNPIESDLDEGVACYKAEGCDFILAIGGGSPLDVGKAIRLRTKHHLPLEEYDDLKGGAEKISADMPSMIAVPTTAGTGSEVGRSAVITLKSTGRKSVIFSPYLIPNLAICDPKITLNLPPKITAATGMDALTHNLESYLSINYHPICDGIALEGVRIASKNIAKAVKHGEDIEARGAMMIAAMMGAIAFQKGLGIAHSLAHPLSSVAGLHHGLANAIMLPYAMEFNLEYTTQRLRQIAVALGVKADGLDGLSDLKIATEGIDLIRALLKEIDIPDRLRDVGVLKPQIPILASQAILDGCHLTNPRACSEKDMMELYSKAF